VSEIGKLIEYWTRWKNLEVTPTTAPYFRTNKLLYEERLKELQKLRDEIVFDVDIGNSYKDSLLQQIFDSITILGRPDKDERDDLINKVMVYEAGIVTALFGKEILDSILKVGKNEKSQ